MAKAIFEKYTDEENCGVPVYNILRKLGEIHFKSGSENCCWIISKNEWQVQVYIEYTKIGIDTHFLFYYALVALILLKEYVVFEYKIEKKSRGKEESIIEKVTLLLIYIQYDVDYRIRNYDHRNKGDVYLPTNHIKVFKDLSDISYDKMLYKERQRAKFESTFLHYSECLNYDKTISIESTSMLPTELLIEMEKMIKTIEKFEEYETISKIKCPKRIYDKYKNIDYTTFGKKRSET